MSAGIQKTYEILTGCGVDVVGYSTGIRHTWLEENGEKGENGTRCVCVNGNVYEVENVRDSWNVRKM